MSPYREKLENQKKSNHNNIKIEKTTRSTKNKRTEKKITEIFYVAFAHDMLLGCRWGTFVDTDDFEKSKIACPLQLCAQLL